LSRDPLVADPGRGQDFNGYAYVRNGPLRYTDPTGWGPRSLDDLPLMFSSSRIEVYGMSFSQREEYARDSIGVFGRWIALPVDEYMRELQYASGGQGGSGYGEGGGGRGSGSQSSQEQDDESAGSNRDQIAADPCRSPSTVPPAKNSDSWQIKGSLAVPGDSMTFTTGRYLKVERGSHTPGLDGAHVFVRADPLARDGSVLPTMRGYPVKPDWNVGGHIGFNLAIARVLDAGFDSPGGFRWKVNIPLQAAAHGNSSGVWVNVYACRE
jgi:hypothetical protein